MKNTYRLEKRDDNHTWVTLEPLMQDIQTNYDKLVEMDTSTFTEKDQELLELKMQGLQQVYQFLGALVLESNLATLREQRKIEEEITKATELFKTTTAVTAAPNITVNVEETQVPYGDGKVGIITNTTVSTKPTIH
jgi:hypothetical protein